MLGDEEGALDVDRHHGVEDVLGVVDDRRGSPKTPALANATSSPPKRSTAIRTASRTWSESVTSVDDVGGALGADLVGDGGEPVLVDVGEDHLRPLVGEQPAVAAPMLPAAAGDQRHLVLQSTHGGGRLPHRVRVPAMAGERAGTAQDVVASGNGGTAAPTVRDATFDVLRRLELTTIFSNPGSTEVPFLAGLPDDLRFVLALHEGSVVGMAAGLRARPRRAGARAAAHHARASATPSPRSPPRASNRAPLVVIVGQQDRRHLALEPFLAGRLDGLAGEYPVWVDQPVRAAGRARARSSAPTTRRSPAAARRS